MLLLFHIFDLFFKPLDPDPIWIRIRNTVLLFNCLFFNPNPDSSSDYRLDPENESVTLLQMTMDCFAEPLKIRISTTWRVSARRKIQPTCKQGVSIFASPTLIGNSMYPLWESGGFRLPVKREWGSL